MTGGRRFVVRGGLGGVKEVGVRGMTILSFSASVVPPRRSKSNCGVRPGQSEPNDNAILFIPVSSGGIKKGKKRNDE